MNNFCRTWLAVWCHALGVGDVRDFVYGHRQRRCVTPEQRGLPAVVLTVNNFYIEGADYASIRRSLKR